MVVWQQIETVFLDMDGTLLDLHFDNYFWLHYVPERYAQKYQITLEQAKQQLTSQYKDIEGTINWYCIDHWTEVLDMDIALLKEEVKHLIQVHPHVIRFLGQVRALDKRVVLVTNAHSKSLNLKLEETLIGEHLDAAISSHHFRIPKEEPQFWDRLNEIEPFNKRHTLFVDDSISVLKSAQNYGIQWLVAIRKPDSQQPERVVEGFDSIYDFREITPE